MRKDNYRTQAERAKTHFLTYDQEALIRKLKLEADGDYLYPVMLGQTYRICRNTGDISRQSQGIWVDGNSYEEVMTLLDLVCDSREDRCLRGHWKNMRDFGQMFHRNLLEGPDPWAVYFQNHREAFREACAALGGKPLPQGDVAYAIEVFDGLCVVPQLWLGDEEFPPNLQYLWDENAWMYIRYETMYFARGLLLRRLRELMER